MLEYKKFLGREKMLDLFLEFKQKVEQDFAKLENADETTARIIFHNLRSASLVFDLKKFSALCKSIEEQVVNGTEKRKLEKQIKNAKITYEKELTRVEQYLKADG